MLLDPGVLHFDPLFSIEFKLFAWYWGSQDDEELPGGAHNLVREREARKQMILGRLGREKFHKHRVRLLLSLAFGAMWDTSGDQ